MMIKAAVLLACGLALHAQGAVLLSEFALRGSPKLETGFGVTGPGARCAGPAQHHTAVNPPQERIAQVFHNTAGKQVSNTTSLPAYVACDLRKRGSCSVNVAKVAKDLGKRSLLFFGSSLDVFALDYFCKSANAPVHGFHRASCMGFRANTYNKGNFAYCDIGGFKLAWSFHPGVSGPPYDPLCPGLLRHDCAHETSAGLIKQSVAKAAKLFGQQPTAIVVDSSLWDVATWWMQAGKPKEPWVAPATRVAKWCQNDFPVLVNSVQAVAPASKVAFRTAPRMEDGATFHGNNQQNMEAMNTCLRASHVDDRYHSVLKKFKMIDYNALVETVLENQASAVKTYYEDAIHPGVQPSELYIDHVMQWVHAQK